MTFADHGNNVGRSSSAGHAALRDRCGDVLDANWIGRSTKPAPALYPHQWSWDSAFIAIGNARRRPDRAVLEMESLFAAQWSDGMVPHIVFDPDATGYFPSQEAWGTGALSPAGSSTSGLCQPPVHASAVRRIAEIFIADGDERQASTMLASLYEPLTAWHGYLHSVRTTTSALVEIWHPWESGMDNSPCWDDPLEALRPAEGDVPEFQRADTDHAAADDRPTDRDYDRYMYLVESLRRRDYRPDDPSSMPFRARDVLFNAALVSGARDLAWIAQRLGADHTSHLERGRAVAEALHREQWSADLGQHVNVDAVTGRTIEVPIAGALVALLADPSPEQTAAIVDTIENRFAAPAADRDGDAGFLVPTVPIGHATFEPTRYWRGPAWVNIMWLIAAGLDRAGRHDLASGLRGGVVGIVDREGAWEYFDPERGVGRGSDSFSWTAALVIDMIDSVTR